MKSYSAKDAKNRLGEVLRAALEAPLVITVHGKPSVCIMSMEASSFREKRENSQNRLDTIKHRISCEVLATFPISEIKKRSMGNIERWRINGFESKAYDEWVEIIKDQDNQKMISAMIGLNQRSNQLRQSIPYVGMIDKEIVRKINEEITT